MRLLFDTHTFLWWDSEQGKLSNHVFNLCQDKQNQLTLSIASIWELQIKIQLGKLGLRKSLKEVIAEQQKDNKIKILQATTSHIFDLDNLPFHHRDPFDRLLIAQARVENMSLLSIDQQFAQYPVNVIWEPLKSAQQS